MISIDFSAVRLKLKQENCKTSVFDPVRKRWVLLTPEEHVRQHILYYLINNMHYPGSMIAVEKNISVGAMNKRFDIVVYNRNHKPWLLAECKAPEIAISETTLQQLLNYQRTVQCNYWLLTNGRQSFCADASDVLNIKWIGSLPAYDL